MTFENLELVFAGSEMESMCRTALEELSERIAQNIIYNKTNSGNAVNSVGEPAHTTGDTVSSLQVITEQTDEGFSIALVGRKGIMNIDRGNPPAKDSGEFSSFNSFYYAIKEWARAKEGRYGLPDKSINAYFVAKKVWELGGVLYRAGGGTETIQDLIPEAVETISQNANNMLDGGISELLNKIEIG